ncbi:MAG: phenylalanine--tRNA ligase subunit alpha, partial [Candidatus Omnitrophica bacterium]|nr:phenylalanine--tRNA ligase subunit alpha [Candidatus Omnitrophota bacterium]
MDIEKVKAEVETEAQAIVSFHHLEEFRVKYLGRKGILAQLTSQIPLVPKEARAGFGQQVNALKNRITTIVTDKEKTVSSMHTDETRGVSCDITMPGIAQDIGHVHPITQIIEEICSIFNKMGFRVVEGPEIETEYNNFSGLNIPLEHPSRDAFDTFYLHAPSAQAERYLLRSHT